MGIEDMLRDCFADIGDMEYCIQLLGLYANDKEKEFLKQVEETTEKCNQNCMCDDFTDEIVGISQEWDVWCKNKCICWD